MNGQVGETVIIITTILLWGGEFSRKVQSIRQSSSWEVVTAGVILLIIKSQFANKIDYHPKDHQHYLCDCIPCKSKLCHGNVLVHRLLAMCLCY